MLAVVTIIAVVASLGIVRLGAASDSARVRAAAESCQELDRLMRLRAGADGPITLAIDADDASFVARDRSGAPLGRAPLPNGFRAALDGSNVVEIDRLGRSDDYGMELVDRDRRTRRWHVLGLTGRIVERSP